MTREPMAHLQNAQASSRIGGGSSSPLPAPANSAGLVSFEQQVSDAYREDRTRTMVDWGERAAWDQCTNGEPPISRRQALLALSQAGIEILYAVRTNRGLIKIGHTTNLAARLNSLGSPPEVLAIKPGTRSDEQAVHAGLKSSLHHGREWYHPTLEVLAVVNEWRAALGRDPL